MMLLPELSLLVFSVVFLFFSLGEKRDNLINVARSLGIAIFALTIFAVTREGSIFYGAYKVDIFTQLFKIILAYGFCLTLFFLEGKDEIEKKFLPEFIMFLGFSTLGLMMLVSANELISIVIALEVSSFSLYVILPLRKGQGRIQLEASMKYLFFGAISTGVMLYGMSYLYGITGSTFLPDILYSLPTFLNQPIGVFALTLTLVGFFFKLSLFPMHFWAPDIYEGASNTTTTFIATVPKVAATAILIKFGLLVSTASPQFVNILMILAGISMTLGNLAGLVQKDIKRLLAYSGIAHAGYIMLGILALSKEGYSAAMFYITIYLLMNMAAFYVIVIMSKKGENIRISDLAGLVRRAPLLAVTLGIAAFSLAGIPPTGGFTGKLFLFTSAFREGYLTIVIIGAVNTVISIFYYLNMVRMSFSKEAVASTSGPFKLTAHEKTLCYIFIFLILYLGIYPFGLLGIFKLAI